MLLVDSHPPVQARRVKQGAMLDPTANMGRNDTEDLGQPPVLLAQIAMTQTPKETGGYQTERNVSTNQKCLGTKMKSQQEVARMMEPEQKCENSLTFSAKTTTSQRSGSDL